MSFFFNLFPSLGREGEREPGERNGERNRERERARGGGGRGGGSKKRFSQEKRGSKQLQLLLFLVFYFVKSRILIF
jgi:hypothetical protein